MEAKPSVATRRASAVDLGKRYGLFVDRQEITQRVVEIELGSWDDEETTDCNKIKNPSRVFNKHIYDKLTDYDTFTEIHYGGASSGKSHG